MGDRSVSKIFEDSVGIRLDSDSDGDTVPESEIDQIVTPTTAGVAIKTKGTGADPNLSLIHISEPTRPY